MTVTVWMVICYAIFYGIFSYDFICRDFKKNDSWIDNSYYKIVSFFIEKLPILGFLIYRLRLLNVFSKQMKNKESKVIKMIFYVEYALKEVYHIDFITTGALFMAQSFFYGYLKKVLPSHGTEYSKAIKEKIYDFIPKRDVDIDDFPAKKLVILMPSSCYIPNEINQYDEYFEQIAKIEKHREDVAGTPRRVYQQTVYKVLASKVDNRYSDFYALLEGATPLVTFYHTSKYSELFRGHKEEFRDRFYEHTKNLLKDDESCSGLYELICYDDRDMEIDEVGKLLVNKLIEVCKPRMKTDNPYQKYEDHNKQIHSK